MRKICSKNDRIKENMGIMKTMLEVINKNNIIIISQLVGKLVSLTFRDLV